MANPSTFLTTPTKTPSDKAISSSASRKHHLSTDASSNHAISEFKNRFEAYNCLQAADVAFGEKLPIPEIVALGDQSDEKSSLLEALLGFRFNVREVEMGTRRPLVLQMVHDSTALEPRCRFQEYFRPTRQKINKNRWKIGHTVPCCPWTNLPCGYNNCGHTMVLQWSRKPWSFDRRFLTCKGQPRCKHFRWIDYNSTSEHQNTGLSNDITEVGSSGGQTQNPVKVTVEEKGKKITLEGNVDEVQGERNCLFPEDPGKLLNDNCMKRKGVSDHQDSYEEAKNDLRSRGLCLVPLSCTLQVGSENGADYWAPTLGGGGYQ